MAKRFKRNRALLAKLIYNKKDWFEKDSLVQEFFEMRSGDIIIDGSQTIAQYLEELTQYGALIFSNGRYRVRIQT